MMGGIGVNGFTGMWIMGLFGLLSLAGVIVLIVWAIRALLSPRVSETMRSSDPLGLLQLRLARGEITPDEYEELRAHLRD